MFSFGACRACQGNSDQQTDTVKVSFNALDLSDKENAAPAATLDEKPEQVEQRRQEEEAAQKEQQRALEEERLRILEEEERERQRLEEQTRKDEELCRQLQEAEEKQQMEDARQRKQLQELQQWLSKNGVKDVNEKKKTSGMVSSGFTFPLHMAVRSNDGKATRLLLVCGADKTAKDSGKLTPLALAQKLDKKASHKDVITALSE